jgi:hypothetical protein
MVAGWVGSSLACDYLCVYPFSRFHCLVLGTFVDDSSLLVTLHIFMDKPQSSAFARGDGEVHIVPMSIIQRPLPSELDEEKVKAFMEEMKVRQVDVCSWLIVER